MSVKEHPRHTWNRERWVLEHLAEALDHGDVIAAARLGERLLDGIVLDNWTSFRFVEEEVYLPFSRLQVRTARQDDVDHVLESDVISVTRAEALANGSQWTPAELTLFRDHVVELGFDSEWATWWQMVAFRVSPRREAFVIGTIEADISRPPDWLMTFQAASFSYQEALSLVRRSAFTSWRDFQARSTEVLAALDREDAAASAPGETQAYDLGCQSGGVKIAGR